MFESLNTIKSGSMIPDDNYEVLLIFEEEVFEAITYGIAFEDRFTLEIGIADTFEEIFVETTDTGGIMASSHGFLVLVETLVNTGEIETFEVLLKTVAFKLLLESETRLVRLDIELLLNIGKLLGFVTI